MAYTVSELAELAGVSVRALHHYDRMGLLVPRRRNRSGYRLYGDEELKRLQQILLFRELDFPLGEIRRILERPGYDPAEALEAHIGNFYQPGPDILEGLGRLYAEPGAFRDRYEALAPGLADYLKDAMAMYAASLRKD